MSTALRPLFFGFMLLLFALAGSAAKAEQQPQHGVIDLRQENFNRRVTLSGEWAFYWKKLILPTNKDKGVFIHFPSKWTDLRVNGKKLPAFGYATYRLKLLLPKNEDSLRIVVPDVYCASRLYINGKLLMEVGKVADNAADFVPKWQYKTVGFVPRTDTTEVVLQISNFIHSKGGIKETLVIGKSNQITLERRRAEAIDLFLTGCLVMGGLFFLGLYLMGNRDKAILLFSLYSIIYGYRIIGVDNYVLHTIIPDLGWSTLIHLEYLTLFISIGLFALYTYYLYPKDVSRSIINSICATCFLFGVVTLVVKPYYFTQLIDPFLVVTVFCIAYAFYIYTVVFIRERPGSIYALMSSGVMMIIFTITLLIYWNIIGLQQFLNFIAYICFFFLQSLILSHRVSFQLKEAKHEAEKALQAKSDFLSNMSHEIRTPLNSVIGLSHLLLKNNPRPDQTEQLDIMLFSANNLLGIVNDILDYNKIEAGKIEFDEVETNIAAIARNVVAGLQNAASEKRIALRIKIDERANVAVLADSTRVFQVLNNLVHNAIKFTHEGYVELVLSVEAETETILTLKTEVIDTGIGISSEKQMVIFDRFTQADNSTSRSFGGTGLGLAISKRILDLQGSVLQVTSAEGYGSNFFFVQTFIKVANAGYAAKPSRPDQKEDSGYAFKGVNILLVEDNSINIIVARGFLTGWGATVDTAANGADALAMMASGGYDLVLMDLNMPVMDGYEATRRMRELGIRKPILALTANLRKDIENKIVQAGMNDVIVKPFLPDELFQKVKKYVRSADII